MNRAHKKAIQAGSRRYWRDVRAIRAAGAGKLARQIYAEIHARAGARPTRAAQVRTAKKIIRERKRYERNKGKRPPPVEAHSAGAGWGGKPGTQPAPNESSAVTLINLGEALHALMGTEGANLKAISLLPFKLDTWEPGDAGALAALHDINVSALAYMKGFGYDKYTKLPNGNYWPFMSWFALDWNTDQGELTISWKGMEEKGIMPVED